MVSVGSYPRKIMNKSTLSLVIVGALLSGCATTQQISSADRANLGSVAVSPTVEKPAKMYYFGPGASIGLLFGAAGGAIVAGTQLAPGEQLRAFAEKNNVQIERIVREEITNAFRKSGKVTLKEAQDPSGCTLIIAIAQYGFSIPNGFSSKLVPIVSIKCSLVDGSGKTIWRSSDSVLPLGNPVEGHTPEDFKNDPNLIEESWRLATRAIAEKIVHKL
jgi:hypothetical protein